MKVVVSNCSSFKGPSAEDDHTEQTDMGTNNRWDIQRIYGQVSQAYLKCRQNNPAEF